MKHYDAIVLGGGMVGAATALNMAKSDLNIAIVDRKDCPKFSLNDQYDLRISAISKNSVDFLNDLDVWQNIENKRAHPYTELATWEQSSNKIIFDAQSLHLPHLGFMVENNLIQYELTEKLKTFNNVNFFISEDFDAQQVDNEWHITFANNEISAPLLIGCDGANSKARDLAKISLTCWDYRQHCMLILVRSNIKNQTQTWQEFHTSGPRAYLPLADDYGCVVWYDSPEKISYLQSLPNEKLALEIKEHFPKELNLVEVFNKGSFPLKRRHVQQYYQNNIVLAGDAAHTINPLAGQGVNIGFKDAKALSEILITAHKQGKKLNDIEVLQQYQKARKIDNLMMQSGMDFFYKTFKTNFTPLKAIRNLAIFTAQKAGFLKREVLKYAIGIK